MAESYVDTLDALDDAFRQKRKLYVSFTKNIENLVDTLLDGQSLEFLYTEARTKTRKSFEKKIRREDKEEKYKSLDDITDLAGLRVIGYYLDDVEKICQIIKNNFQVDEKNSRDTRLTIPANQFGYLSVHFVVSHKEERLVLPENKPFAGMKVEIQVRTVLQHAWAVLDRRFRYDKPEDLPREVQRKLFRIGAQLEASDEDLASVERRILSLREGYAQDFQKGDFAAAINRESLDVFLDTSPDFKTIVAAARKAGMHLGNEKYKPSTAVAGLLAIFEALGVKTVEDAKMLLKEAAKIAQDRFAVYHRLDSRKGLISRMTALRILLGLAPGSQGQTALQHSGLPGRIKHLIQHANEMDTPPAPRRRLVIRPKPKT